MNHYYLLGRSGLRVSRLALGTMNFGTGGLPRRLRQDRGGGGADLPPLRRGGRQLHRHRGLLHRRRERDHPRQADRAAGVRDRLVLTTKFTNTVDPTDPNAGGNGRKHMIRAVEASLRRLGTDYLDLYLLHTWDRITPVEEVVRTFDDLVRAGKIRYAGPFRRARLVRRPRADLRRGPRADADGHRAAAVLAGGPRHRGRVRADGADPRASASPRGARSAAACSPASTGAPATAWRARAGSAAAAARAPGRASATGG